jgi:uncharacterized protein (TIGR02147 family)
MVSLFNYTDYRNFLRDYIQEKKGLQPSYSIRLLSQKAGIKSGGFLSMALRGQRNISPDLSSKIAQALKLTKKECDYFILMVQYTQEESLQQRHELLQQMFTLIRSNTIRTLAPEQYEFYDRWYYAAIRELVELYPTFDNNIEIVSSHLNPPVKPREAQQALKVLQRLNLIEKDSEGRYHRTDTVISCGDNIRPVAIRNFQRTMIERSKDALDTIDRTQRDFSSLTLSIDAATWNQITSKIGALRVELLDCASKVASPDRIIQVNFQAFPLTITNSHDNTPPVASNEKG